MTQSSFAVPPGTITPPSNASTSASAPAVKTKKASAGALNITETTDNTRIQRRANVGLMAGPGFYNLTGKNVNNAQVDVGLVVGLNTEIRINRIAYFQPEILYVHKKASVEDISISRDYIEVPLLLKFKTAEPVARNLYPYFFVGPNLGFHLSTSSTQFFKDPDDVNTHVTETTSLDKKSDAVSVAVDAGVGAEKKFSETASGFASFRFSYGTNDTFTDKDAGVSFKNYGFQFLIGAKYAL